ncbi:MAG TPA: hypothetical protein VFZ66_05750 [Herpetosiphonaceae bacterium]
MAGVRWSTWLLALTLLWYTGALARLESTALPLLSLSYSAIYLLLWTLLVPRFVVRTREGSAVVLYDLILSAVPVWLSGGWGSPFLPYMLGALVVPAVIRGWSGGLLVAAAALAIDQVMLWTTPRSPWEIATSQPLALLGRTLLPFGVVAAIRLTVELWCWLRRSLQRRARQVQPPVRWEYPPVQSVSARASGNDPIRYERSSDAAPLSRTWSKERASQPTLERRSPATIQAALRHLMPDFQAAGVSVAMQVEGDERQLPDQVRELLIKAIEIGMDNVLSHARAQAVTVALQVTHDDAVLRVADDGIGLFDGTAEPPGFHQVKRLRFRAQEIGGELRVVERDEGGVELHLRLPLVE